MSTSSLGTGREHKGPEAKQEARMARVDGAAAHGVCAIYLTPSQLKAPGPQRCPQPEGSRNFPSLAERKLKSPALILRWIEVQGHR